MKGKLRNRIAGERGASLLYALLFLLVATMVSAVILHSSTSALALVHEDEQRQQENLTLTSAGGLVRSYLSSASCRYELHENGDDSSITVQMLGEDNPLNEELQLAMASAVKGKTASGDFTVEVEPSQGAGALEGSKVNVHFEMTQERAALGESQDESQDEEQGDSSETPEGTTPATTEAHPGYVYTFTSTLSLEGSDNKLFLTAAAQTSNLVPNEDGSIDLVENIAWKNADLSTRNTRKVAS